MKLVAGEGIEPYRSHRHLMSVGSIPTASGHKKNRIRGREDYRPRSGK